MMEILMDKIFTILKIFEELKMKVNYSELSRFYGISRQTISKYNKGYMPSKSRKRNSVLDKYKSEISDKLSLPGSTITGVYKYIYSKDSSIGSRSNFDYYVRKHNLRQKSKSEGYPRYETKYGHQLQFDFKEDIIMESKTGEIFKFHIFTTTLSASRMHKFTYTKSKTESDVIRCLISAFNYYGGVPKELLTDNMSSIFNPRNKKVNERFNQFCKDFNIVLRSCKVKSPATKGKVESSNRFISRLIPYNKEFSNESELIEIIDKLTIEVNNEINQTTKLKPVMLLSKEREELSPLPSFEIIDYYLNYEKVVKVYKDSMIYYKGNRYSVPSKYINKNLKLKEQEGNIYIYDNTQLIRIHKLSTNPLNYAESDYKNLLSYKLKNKSSQEIEAISSYNLELLNNFQGGNK
jgi:transposase